MVESLRQKYKLNDLLKFTKLNRKTFYYHRQRLDYDKYTQLKDVIKWLFIGSDETYGYRRMHLELLKMNYLIDDETVRKLMREMGLMANCYWKKSGKFSSYKGECGEIRENIVRKDFVQQSDHNFTFKVSAPYTVLATDVTQININNQKLYLSVIVDIFSKEILAYDIRNSPNMKQVINCLILLKDKIPNDSKAVLHSDQGHLYQLPEYQDKVKSLGLIQSMSRKGNCLDNAPIESFFSLLKREFIYRRKFKNTESFKSDLSNYIHRFNHNRISVKKGLTPIETRNQALVV